MIDYKKLHRISWISSRLLGLFISWNAPDTNKYVFQRNMLAWYFSQFIILNWFSGCQQAMNIFQIFFATSKFF